MKTVSRRKVLAGMMAAVAATEMLLAGDARANGPSFLDRLLGDMEIGTIFHGNWELIEAYPPRAGAVILIVAKEMNRPIRVDVCRRDHPVRAPAYTEYLELYVMDGGAGKRRIAKDLVKALQALANQLQRNESQHFLAEDLLTHRERLEQFPAFMEGAAEDLSPGVADPF